MVEELPAGTPRDVDAWLADIETSASADQFEVLKLVAGRVKAEMAEGDRAPPLSQPLIWLVHGRPGVGKTDGVLKPIKALFERCGYKQGWKLRHLLNLIITCIALCCFLLRSHDFCVFVGFPLTCSPI